LTRESLLPNINMEQHTHITELSYLRGEQNKTGLPCSSVFQPVRWKTAHLLSSTEHKPPKSDSPFLPITPRQSAFMKAD